MKIKRLITLFVIIALVVFFTLPSLLFGEPGDQSTAMGPTGGQYQMNPMDDPNADLDADLNDSYSDAPEEAPAGEIMDVYCIDDDVVLTRDTDAYIETDIDVSDELMADVVPEVNAEAVEIMATTATGALDYYNQEAVWDLIEGDTSPPGSTVEAIVDAVTTIAEGFVADVNEFPDDVDPTLQEYLDIENVNEIEVTLDTDPLVDSISGDYNNFDATAIMENPLVPEVTDEGKTVFWYILAGSYNVSFFEFDLITEETSTMTDKVDVNDATDEDGDGNKADDHYGYATIPYYFYWWGNDYPEFEVMSVNIGACVDIDEDGDIDKEKGEDLDEFNLNANVVQTIVNPDYNGGEADGPYNSPHIVTYSGGNVVTAIPDNVDIDYFNAGKVLVTVTREEAGDLYPTDQRFCIESYSEPCDAEDEMYSAWGRFEVTKTDSVTQEPVAGAVYKLTYISGQTNTPDPIPVYDLTTGADGKASVSGLPWGTYELKEFSSPLGYLLDPSTYTIYIGGTALFDEESGIDGSIVAGQDVENEPGGSITICKTDATNGAPLLGSTFQLWRYGRQVINGNDLNHNSTAGAILNSEVIGGPILVGEVTLTDSNCYTWGNLPFGRYIVREIVAPQGYLLAPDVLVNLNSGNRNPVLVREIADPRIPGSITLNKSGLGSTTTAGFTLYDSSNNPVGAEKTVTGNGSITWSDLSWDTYKIVETTTPSGYTQMADITGIVVGSAQLNYSFDRVNTKKTTTKKTTTPGVIEVLGIQELPFTGMNPAIPISGISSIFAGGLMVMLSSIRRRFRRK
jgi:hypothetical protein